MRRSRSWPRDYLTNGTSTFAWARAEVEAIARFFGAAAELGLIEQPRRSDWPCNGGPDCHERPQGAAPSRGTNLRRGSPCLTRSNESQRLDAIGSEGPRRCERITQDDASAAVASTKP